MHTASTPRAHQGWDVLATSAVLQGDMSTAHLRLVSIGVANMHQRHSYPLGATRSMAICRHCTRFGTGVACGHPGCERQAEQYRTRPRGATSDMRPSVPPPLLLLLLSLSGDAAGPCVLRPLVTPHSCLRIEGSCICKGPPALKSRP